MVRSLVAVTSGFVIIALLSFGTDLGLRAAMPQLYEADGSTTSVTALVLSIGYVGLYATLGCYLTARLAPRQPMTHALVLGGLGLLFNIVGTVFTWDMAPLWYHVVSLALVMLWAWIGGRMREQELTSASSRSVTA